MWTRCRWRPEHLLYSSSNPARKSHGHLICLLNQVIHPVHVCCDVNENEQAYFSAPLRDTLISGKFYVSNFATALRCALGLRLR